MMRNVLQDLGVVVVETCMDNQPLEALSLVQQVQAAHMYLAHCLLSQPVSAIRHRHRGQARNGHAIPHASCHDQF